MAQPTAPLSEGSSGMPKVKASRNPCVLLGVDIRCWRHSLTVMGAAQTLSLEVRKWFFGQMCPYFSPLRASLQYHITLVK